jgi:hypothetical protein
MKPTLSPPGIKRLKLKSDEPLSSFAVRLKLAPLQQGGRGRHAATQSGQVRVNVPPSS